MVFEQTVRQTNVIMMIAAIVYARGGFNTNASNYRHLHLHTNETITEFRNQQTVQTANKFENAPTTHRITTAECIYTFHSNRIDARHALEHKVQTFNPHETISKSLER